MVDSNYIQIVDPYQLLDQIRLPEYFIENGFDGIFLNDC